MSFDVILIGDIKISGKKFCSTDLNAVAQIQPRASRQYELYGPNRLMLAKVAVESKKMTVKRAAIAYRIPLRTLYNHTTQRIHGVRRLKTAKH